MIRCNLYEIERQFALLEISAPLGYEVGKTLGVLTCRVAYVGTALIEEDSLHAIVQDRMEGSVAPEKRVEEVPLELRILRHLEGVEVFFRVLFQIVTVEPAFYSASTLVCHHQSHRHVERLVDNLCKEISGGRCIAHGFWINLLPFAVGVIQRFAAHHARNLHVVYTFILVGFQYSLVVAFYRAVAETFHRHLHVALSGADPYFTSQYIIEGSLFAIIEGNGERSVASLGSLYLDSPLAILSGLCRILLLRP